MLMYHFMRRFADLDTNFLQTNNMKLFNTRNRGIYT